MLWESWTKFDRTRPKPAFGRQGLDWDRWARIQFPWNHLKKTMETNQKPWNNGNQPKWLVSHGSRLVTWQTRGPNWPPLIQKRYVTDAGPQLTSFDPKTLRDRRGAPTDLLWSKKRYVTDAGPQLTSFDPKNVTWQTRGPNWPTLIQKTLRDRRGAPTDLLDV